uniref:uncharacterized protein LOC132663919 n=1 Tax=Panthera onca TaxID=9690 RepID=UPI002954947F|nr:uncharacterized protein LOC132663919 [Panthera onca]
MAFILQMRKCKLKSARANPNPGAESGRGGGATLRLGDGLQDRATGAGGREAAAVRTIGGATRLQLGLPGGSRGRASRPFSVPRGRPRRHRPVGPRRPPYVFGALGVAPPPAEAKAKAQTDARAGDRRTFERPDPPPHTLSPQLPPRPGRPRLRRRGPYTLGLSWACGVDGPALCSGCALGILLSIRWAQRKLLISQRRPGGEAPKAASPVPTTEDSKGGMIQAWPIRVPHPGAVVGSEMGM